MEYTNGSGGSSWERPDAPLGTLVYRAGLLSKEKLESALEEGRRSGRRLGEILLQKGWIEEKDLARLLAGQKGLAFVSLRGRGFDPEIARLLPERVCRYHCALAMEEEAGKLLVAVADPTDDSAVGDIRAELNQDFRLVVATASEIRKALDDVFSGPAPAQVSAESPGLTVAEAEPEPAPVVPSVASGLGLRVAAPEPEPEPAPEPEPEPAAPSVAEATAVEPEQATPVFGDPRATPEPNFLADFAPPQPVAPTREPEFRPVEFSPSEPTIERNEEAHVSVAFHVPAPEPVPEPEPEPQPEPEPEPEPEPPFAAAPPPVTALPEPPALAPEPPAPAEVRDPEHDREQPFRVVLVMDDEEEVEVGSYADEDAAVDAARDLITRIARLEEWPRIGRRFLRPERIVSVDIRERMSFSGSRSRAQWGAPAEPSPS